MFESRQNFTPDCSRADSSCDSWAPTGSANQPTIYAQSMPCSLEPVATFDTRGPSTHQWYRQLQSPVRLQSV